MPGVSFYVIPRHFPALIDEYVASRKPPVMKVRIGCSSATQVQAWHRSSPGTIIVAVDGPLVDNHAALETQEPKALAREEVDAFCRWQDVGWRQCVFMRKNEPHLWIGTDFIKRWVDYTCEGLRLGKQRGVYGQMVGNTNTGWPRSIGTDDVNWFNYMAPIFPLLGANDYWSAHEYFGPYGPLAGKDSHPYLVGRHWQIPYECKIILGELGMDRHVEDGQGNRGWRGAVTLEQYVEMLHTATTLLSPKVRGYCLFVLDYENNQWESFDLVELLKRPDLLDRLSAPAASLVVVPKLTCPVPEPYRLTQKFRENPGYYRQFGVEGHNGLDFSVVTGTPIRACDAGKVVKVQHSGTGYGNAVWLSHIWGWSLYGHASETLAQAGQTVRAGDVIMRSGNSGNSTGPHLHFGVRRLGQFDTPMNHWCDPMGLLTGGGTLATPGTPTTPAPSIPAVDVTAIRWSVEEAVREIEAATRQGEAARKRLLDNVLGQLYRLEGVK